ncbi:MAG: LD-carboxypeptidase [Kordia sp.]|nr:MAG: LD-carboxypeptidase [Kordia sp.]
MNTKQPQSLQRGDLVAIVATARKMNRADLQKAIELLESWGLNAVVGKTIGKADHQFGGTDTDRITDFQEAMNNDAIKAIWCARGGYGTVRILDGLDFSKFTRNPKWVIGFSDVTALHSHIHNLGVQSIHGLMPITVKSSTPEAILSLKNCLFGNPVKHKVPCESKNKYGIGEGELVGGNLSILYSLLGSESAIKTDGKILFIEDLDEYLYHVDRMMMNLKRNGYFNNLKGLIVGGMTKMNDNTIPFGKTTEEIILDNIKEFDFPVCFNFPAGHLKDNRALKFGKTVAFNVSKEGTHLKFL